jgi:hypothetical protein
MGREPTGNLPRLWYDTSAVFGIRIRRIRMFLGSRIRIHDSEEFIWIRIPPFSHKGVERTAIMLAK